MTLLNYNDPTWSISMNCKALNDCSGRTITSNGSKGLAILTNHQLPQTSYDDLFHFGIEFTGITALLSLHNKRLAPLAKYAGATVLTAYIIGRISQNR